MTNPIELLTALRVAETGLTPAELLALPMDEYARVTGRATPTQAALAALNAQETPAPSQAPDSAFKQTVETPQGIPLEELALTDDQAFLTWRQQRQSGGEGVGIFSGVGSQSQTYRAAAARQAGRTGWANSNVIEPPRIEGRYLRHDDQIDHRSAAERLSNAANLWQER